MVHAVVAGGEVVGLTTGPAGVVAFVEGALLVDSELLQAVRARAATIRSNQSPCANLFIGGLPFFIADSARLRSHHCRIDIRGGQAKGSLEREPEPAEMDLVPSGPIRLPVW
jgi:hypothetical protein